MLKVGLDLDQTICDFMGPYLKMFGKPTKDSIITKHVMRDLRNNKDFWLNLPIINRPNFNVTLYCTARVNKKLWNKRYIYNNNLPTAPVYQVYGHGLSKAPLIKGRVDVFIDDSVMHFEDLNSKGIPCLLINSEFNQNYNTKYRIYSLDIDEIKATYNSMLYGY